MKCIMQIFISSIQLDAIFFLLHILICIILDAKSPANNISITSNGTHQGPIISLQIDCAKAACQQNVMHAYKNAFALRQLNNYGCCAVCIRKTSSPCKTPWLHYQMELFERRVNAIVVERIPNPIVANDLATQVARSLATMVLTLKIKFLVSPML